jgi:hypothetical protein
MGLLTKEILLEASGKEKEFGPINKEIDTRASSKRTKRTVQASSHGQMVIYTRGNSETMSEKVKVKWLGAMEATITVTGKEEYPTA